LRGKGRQMKPWSTRVLSADDAGLSHDNTVRSQMAY